MTPSSTTPPPGPDLQGPAAEQEEGETFFEGDPVDGMPSAGGRLRTLLTGASWQSLAQLAPLVINLVLTPYIMHGLGLPIYAIFILVSTVQYFLAAIDGGIGPSAHRYFTLYAGRDDKVATTRLLTSLATLIAASATVLFVVAWLLAPAIVDFFGEVTDADPSGAIFLLRALVVIVAVGQLRGLFAFVLYAQQRFAFTSLTMLLGHAVYTVGLIWTIEGGHGLRGVAYTLLVQQAVATVLLLVAPLKHLTRSGVRFVDKATFADFFRYAWKVQFSSLLELTAVYGDTLIVGRLRPMDTAYFGPGATFAQQLRMMPMNAFTPIQSLLGREVGARGEAGALPEFERVQRLWVKAVTGWVAIGAPAAYFGVQAWLNMGRPLPGTVTAVLLVAGLFQLLAVVLVIWCLVLGRSDLELRYGIAGLVLNLTLTIALIIPFGVVGSVVATAIAAFLATCYLCWVVRRELELTVRLPLQDVPVLPALVAAAVSAVGVWGANHLVGPVVPHGALGLVTCALGALPAVVAYALLTFGPAEIRRVIARVRGG